MEDNRVELVGQIINVVSPRFKDHRQVTLNVKCTSRLTGAVRTFDYHQLQLSRDFYQQNYLTISKAKSQGTDLYFQGYLKSVKRVDSLGRIFTSSQVVVSHIFSIEKENNRT